MSQVLAGRTGIAVRRCVVGEVLFAEAFGLLVIAFAGWNEGPYTPPFAVGDVSTVVIPFVGQQIDLVHRQQILATLGGQGQVTPVGHPAGEAIHHQIMPGIHRGLYVVTHLHDVAVADHRPGIRVGGRHLAIFTLLNLAGHLVVVLAVLPGCFPVSPPPPFSCRRVPVCRHTTGPGRSRSCRPGTGDGG